MSLGYTSFKDEEKVEQESSLSHEDHIIPKVSALLHTKCKSARVSARESSKPVLNAQPDLNHCCSLQCLNILLKNLCQMHKPHPSAP